MATPMSEILSPCVNICDLDQTGEWCMGCGRSLDEIAGWASASDEERRAVIEMSAERLRHRIPGAKFDAANEG